MRGIIVLSLLLSFYTANATNPTNCTQVHCGAGHCCMDAFLGPICFDKVRYACPTEADGKSTLCGSGLNACSGICFDEKTYRCSAGVISVRPPVIVSPLPAPVQLPTQTADVRIINNCKTSLWIEARHGSNGVPLPGQTATATLATPGNFIDFAIPATGLTATRFWAKYGCDKDGKNCTIGDQAQYWPNGGCPGKGCSPPIDSLFEATFGCKAEAPCSTQNPNTWFDTSQVDGWTIPYRLRVTGATDRCDCSGKQCPGFGGVDASKLDLGSCPSVEDLSMNGTVPFATVNGEKVALNAVDLRVLDPESKKVIGCMSPCKKLTSAAPWGLGQSENTGSSLYMCCPTPGLTPEQCRAGPIEKTSYVSAVRSMAPGVYSYSYDDAMGLHSCPAGSVIYTMEFCPVGSAAFPL